MELYIQLILRGPVASHHTTSVSLLVLFLLLLYCSEETLKMSSDHINLIYTSRNIIHCAKYSLWLFEAFTDDSPSANLDKDTALDRNSRQKHF